VTGLGFTGDVMLGRNVDARHRSGPPEGVWGTVHDRLRGLDGLFVNLECVLSRRGERWTRTDRPFHFRADPDWAVPALEAAGVDYASLANNHTLDFETVALGDTLDALEGADIAYAGGGPDAAAAREPAVVTVDGCRVAVVAFTDNTPEYAAGPDSPGVARVGMDASVTDREIIGETLSRAREQDPDLLVASLHWGPNMVEVPDRRYRHLGRWLTERGVDVVHGHSAHVFQGIERHDGGLVLYDAGDFVDDYAVDPELRNDRGFLFVLRTTGAGDLEGVGLHPIEIDRCTVREAGGEVASWCRETMRERSEPFGTAGAYERAGDGLWLPV